MTEQQQRKRDIRAFMQAHYTDERLAMLLAHTQSGKLSYLSCCCIKGIPTANHPLQGMVSAYNKEPHYQEAGNLSGANTAGPAYFALCSNKQTVAQDDAVRRRILIPMIRAEMKRRARVATPQLQEVMQ